MSVKKFLYKKIEVTRFELATPWSQTRCSTKLSHTSEASRFKTTNLPINYSERRHPCQEKLGSLLFLQTWKSLVFALCLINFGISLQMGHVIRIDKYRKRYCLK